MIPKAKAETIAARLNVTILISDILAAREKIMPLNNNYSIIRKITAKLKILFLFIFIL
ncbi:hypothetical protein I0Q91_03780 [Halanaerobiaceae bacterium Z-7014]|uniref:Uncharacterized protein n=1 Tax=Halonatronomonas betaini TaxID=2778430 RepID=A0A931AQI0_9FIRM|nr:hypothetical protein [Halonatronomonas betaini]MBF8436189.1 hypothetical protein [Halonatronomonas betaini]